MLISIYIYVIIVMNYSKKIKTKFNKKEKCFNKLFYYDTTNKKKINRYYNYKK